MDFEPSRGDAQEEIRKTNLEVTGPQFSHVFNYLTGNFLNLKQSLSTRRKIAIPSLVICIYVCVCVCVNRSIDQ